MHRIAKFLSESYGSNPNFTALEELNSVPFLVLERYTLIGFKNKTQKSISVEAFNICPRSSSVRRHKSSIADRFLFGYRAAKKMI